MGGRLSGRSALVTGGSRGIGFSVARALAREGAEVVITSRSENAAREAAAALNAEAPEGAGAVRGIGAHAADEAAAVRCVAQIMKVSGRIDMLVNNAGTNPAFGKLEQQDHGRFAKTVEVNLWAPLLWTNLVAAAWMRDNGGAVVNIASIGGMTVQSELGVYNATKAALLHVTRQQALELAPAVRVNAVAPGIVRSRLAEVVWSGREEQLSSTIPLGRVGEPDDIARAVSFLVGDDASWITGATLVVDGGMMLGDVGALSSESDRRLAMLDG